ncbi:MAG: hypothetical protein KC502_21920, partial [Myxococcales bacterium]|nr:hypothetical protein [Myxococcales bacterium]
MADTSPIALQSHFSAASRQDWQTAAVAALKGRPLEKLTRTSIEGITSPPVFDTPAPTEEAASPSPLLRGHASLDRRMAGWDIRVPISAGSAQEAARIARIET